MSRHFIFEDDHFHDECGVFGIFGHEEAAKLTFLGLHALQHRGQESAGIVSTDGGELHIAKGMGLVQEIFTLEVIRRLPGRWRSATRGIPPPATPRSSTRSRL